jgi:hypothetical protein
MAAIQINNTINISRDMNHASLGRAHMDERSISMSYGREKYLYVRATRAAMYLGMTVSCAKFPEKIVSLRDRLTAQWP